MDNIESNVIRNIRFPLVILVIMVHTDVGVGFATEGYTVYNNYLKLFSNIAVPVFYIISGYLFYYGISSFPLSLYIRKISARIRTLLIPYLLWNAFYMLFILAIQICFPSLIGNARKAILEYSFFEVINSFWNWGGVYHGMPILYSFWYIRDLMVICLVSPIVFFILRKCMLPYFILLFGLFVFNPFNFSPTDMDWLKAFLFFSIGAYWAINRKSILIAPNVALIFASVLVILLVLYPVVSYSSYLHQLILIIFAGIMPRIFSASVFCNKSMFSNLSSSVMFVYAFHLFIIMVFNKGWLYVFPVNEFTAGLMRLTIPVITAVVCVGVFSVLRHLMPRFTNILIGGRM